MGVSLERNHFAVGMKCNAMRRGDPLDEIGGHRGLETIAPNEQMNMAGRESKMECSLASGVAAPYHHNFLPYASGCFHSGCRIVHTLIFELPVVRHVQTPIASARSDNDCARKDRLTPLERKRVSALGFLNIGYLARDGEARAKLLRLHGGVLCQL